MKWKSATLEYLIPYVWVSFKYLSTHFVAFQLPSHGWCINLESLFKISFTISSLFKTIGFTNCRMIKFAVMRNITLIVFRRNSYFKIIIFAWNFSSTCGSPLRLLNWLWWLLILKYRSSGTLYDRAKTTLPSKFSFAVTSSSFSWVEDGKTTHWSRMGTPLQCVEHNYQIQNRTF